MTDPNRRDHYITDEERIVNEMHDKHMQEQECTIYVGSLWHEHCDPFVTVIGFDNAEVLVKLDDLTMEEFDRVCLDIPEDEQDSINLMSGGVHAESYADLDDFPWGPGIDDELARDELESDGITVV
jgi:hypothetical protein